MKRSIITGLIAIGLVGGGFGISQIQDKESNVTNDSTPAITETQPNSTSNPDADESSNVNNPSTISMDEYEQIKPSMTYDQVVKIIGGPEDSKKEVGTNGSDSSRIGYDWKGEGGTNSLATIYFKDGKVSSKGQSGLK